MRFGKIAVYQGNEYELTIRANGTIDLFFPQNPSNRELESKKLFKNVNREDIEMAYYTETYGIYKGNRFQVINKNESNVLLVGNNRSLKELENLDFKKNEQGIWLKWIEQHELEQLREFRVPVKGFPMHHLHERLKE